MCMLFWHYFFPVHALMERKDRGEMSKGGEKREERGLRIKTKKKKKGKRWERVIPLIRNRDSDLFGLISHLRLCTSLSLFSLLFLTLSLSPHSLPVYVALPLTLHSPFVALVSLSRYFSLFSYPAVSHQQKTSHAQFGVQPVKPCFEYTHTHTHSSIYSYNSSIQPRE